MLTKIGTALKKFYEYYANELKGGEIGIDQFLFNTRDEDASASTFNLDELSVEPHGVSFRRAGEQSALRPYTPGIGTMIEVDRTSEKTPLTEQLKDAVIVGGSDSEATKSRSKRLLGQVFKQHTIAHQITRWKLAIDVMRTGKFSPRGLKGGDIGIEVDFGRDASLSKTYDFTAGGFTAGGADINEALKELYNAYRAKGGSTENLIIIMGSQWLEKVEADTDFLQKIQSNPLNNMVDQSERGKQLANVKGLNIFMNYTIPGTIGRVKLATFQGQGKYKAYSGDAGVDYFPSNEALIFSTDSERYNVLRGFEVMANANSIVRVSGDIVFDAYVEADPLVEYIRSAARYVFVPANVDHTAVSVGTFA